MQFLSGITHEKEKERERECVILNENKIEMSSVFTSQFLKKEKEKKTSCETKFLRKLIERL